MDTASFQAILTSLGRQTGGGMRGKMIPEGLVLARFSPEDPLVKVGLREGDLVTKLNGHAMAEPDHILDATLDVMKTGVFDAQVMRAGTPIRILVESASWKATRAATAASSTSGSAPRP